METKISRIDLLTPMKVTHSDGECFVFVDFISELVYSMSGELKEDNVATSILKIVKDKKSQGVMANLAPDIQDKYEQAMTKYREGVASGKVCIKSTEQIAKS